MVLGGTGTNFCAAKMKNTASTNPIIVNKIKFSARRRPSDTLFRQEKNNVAHAPPRIANKRQTVIIFAPSNHLFLTAVDLSV